MTTALVALLCDVAVELIRALTKRWLVNSPEVK